MDITVKPVTRQNFAAVTGLSVAPDQASFVSPNLRALAEVSVEPTWAPLAICVAQKPVGFAVIGQHEASGRWCIILLMIDAEHLGKGYGSAALSLLIALLVERQAPRQIYLGYVPGNAVAARLYARFGFVPTGEVDDGNIIARLDVGYGL